MYYREKFVTNSSSTCFTAFGAYVDVVDLDKFQPIVDGSVEIDDGVGIAFSRLDAEGAVVYLEDTRSEASEYALWQCVYTEKLDEVSALERLEKIAAKYGCAITGQPPCWGFYNSGH